MRRLICNEFLKAVPRRTLLWATGIWVAFLVWGLVFAMGNNYLSAVAELQVVSGDPNISEQLRRYMEDRVAAFPVLLSARFASSHGLALFAALGAIIVAILASKLFGDEYACGTIRRLWTEGPPRAMHIAGKLGAICLIVLVAMAFTCFVALLLTPVVRWFYPIPWHSDMLSPHPGQPVGQLAMQLLTCLIMGLLLAVVAGLVASAGRSAIVGPVVVLTVLTMEPLFPRALQRILPIWHQRTLLERAFSDFTPGSEAPGPALPGLIQFWPSLAGLEASPAVALAVLAAYLLLFIGLLHIVWRRQEVQ